MAVCGEPPALSATEMAAVNVAAEAGVKLTEMVQLAAAARVVPQVLAAMAKSAVLAPVRVMPVMLRAAVPGLESVVDIAVAVVAMVVFGKVMAVGVSMASGTAAATPVPVSVAV